MSGVGLGELAAVSPRLSIPKQLRLAPADRSCNHSSASALCNRRADPLVVEISIPEGKARGKGTPRKPIPKAQAQGNDELQVRRRE